MQSPNRSGFDFLFAFFFPTVVGKILILYFGSNYSTYPGEGYGYGLILAVFFTVFSLGRFFWRYRHED